MCSGDNSVDTWQGRQRLQAMTPVSNYRWRFDGYVHTQWQVQHLWTSTMSVAVNDEDIVIWMTMLILSRELHGDSCGGVATGIFEKTTVFAGVGTDSAIIVRERYLFCSLHIQVQPMSTCLSISLRCSLSLTLNVYAVVPLKKIQWKNRITHKYYTNNWSWGWDEDRQDSMEMGMICSDIDKKLRQCKRALMTVL